MSDWNQRRLTSKRRKVTCTECNESFDSDYTKKHMQKHHPELVKEGKTPTAHPKEDNTQSKLFDYFPPSKSSTQQPEPSSSSTTPDPDERASQQLFPSQSESVTQQPVPSSSSTITDQEEQASDDSIDAPADIPIDIAIHQCESPAQNLEFEEKEEENIEKNVSSDNDRFVNKNLESSDESSDGLNADSDGEPGDFHVNLDDIQAVEHGPVQPILSSYPVTIIRGRNRRFQSSWFKTHPWLEYDQEKDEASCFSCKNFGREGEKGFEFSDWADV